MGLSSVDIANMTASEAQRSAEDLQVLVDWLLARVETLEARLEIETAPRPELPSERRSRLDREYWAQRREEHWNQIDPFIPHA